MFEQLLAHLWGDYLLQSDWMAENKTKDSRVAFIHAGIYTLPFLIFFTRSIPALAVIFLTHAAIDRFRLARYVVWAKNWMGPRKKWFRVVDTAPPTWTDELREGDEKRVFFPDGYNAAFAPTPPFWACRATGYPPNRPVWLTVWLLIIADNVLHLTINYAALRWL